MWKTALILSISLNTSRTLFLMTTDVSLWDVNPAAEQTPLKGSGLVSYCWVLLMSRILAGHLFLICMCHPQLQVMLLCSESELYSMLPSGSETGRSGPWGIGLIAEGTLRYLTWCLFLQFIPYRFIMQR